MKLETFITNLYKLRPNIELLKNRGYDEKHIIKLMTNEYILVQKENIEEDISSSTNIVDFLKNFKLDFFRIRNIEFSDILRNLGDFLLVGGIEGGYLGLDEKTRIVYIIYADDIESNHEIFAENDSQFFELLLLIAEYSSEVSEGKIDAFDEELIEDYIERCYEVCQLGSYEIFF